jgi:hypothetical protein
MNYLILSRSHIHKTFDVINDEHRGIYYDYPIADSKDFIVGDTTDYKFDIELFLKLCIKDIYYFFMFRGPCDYGSNYDDMVNHLDDAIFFNLFGFTISDFERNKINFKKMNDTKSFKLFLKMYECENPHNFKKSCYYETRTSELLQKTDLHLKFIYLFNYKFQKDNEINYYRIREKVGNTQFYTIPNLKLKTCIDCSKSIIVYKSYNLKNRCHQCEKRKHFQIIDHLCGKDGPLNNDINFMLKQFF